MPLNNSDSFVQLVDQAGKARLVLLGESTNDTQEFYAQRVKITKRLIKEKQFSFIALEVPWPEIQRLNQYIINDQVPKQTPRDIMLEFYEWPEWMIRNREIEQLVIWLREHNKTLSTAEKVRFYGIDLYNQESAMSSLLAFIQQYFPSYYSWANEKLQCFSP